MAPAEFGLLGDTGNWEEACRLDPNPWARARMKAHIPRVSSFKRYKLIDYSVKHVYPSPLTHVSLGPGPGGQIQI